MNTSLPFTRHRSNDVVSGLLHLMGVALAIAILVILIILAAKKESAWHIVGYSLYGTGLILLYFASASYHLLPGQFIKLKPIAKRLDHALIYVLIAATYTPILFIVLNGGWRWSLFGIIWGLAALGFTVKMFSFSLPSYLSVGLYLAMGWLIVIAFSPLAKVMSSASLWLLLAGGIAYTLGVIFFALESVIPPRKYFWMHEIFHVFVLLGSTLHTIVMFQIL